MLIRFGLGGQLSGSVGGVVAGHNKGGQYLRNRSIPVNPNSARQLDARQSLAAAAQTWRSINASDREDWENYASQTNLINRLGETITVSGFNQYVRTNSFLAGLGQALLTAAPTSPGLSSMGTGPTVTVSVADGITLNTVGATATKANSTIVQIGPSLSPGVSFFRGPYTYWNKATATSSGFNDVAAAGALRYGTPIAGQLRPVRIRGMDDQGRISNVIETIVAVVA